ncbi:MAG: CAP domain-containing protein [Candidatus Saccharimonas sp.]
MPEIKKTKRKVQLARTRVKKRVKLAVIPQKANQFRPHAVRRYGIAAILALVIGFQLVYSGFTGSSVLGVKRDISTSGLLADTNKARAEQGQSPLVMNDALSRAAQMKANNMFTEQYWAHNSPKGETPWHWFEAVGYNYSSAGENLAKNFSSDDGTIAAWLASPTHRANVLNADYKDVGFAIVDGMLNGDQTTLIVALYAKPAVSAVQGTTATHLDAANVNPSISFMTKLGLSIQAMTPAAVSSVVVLIIAANVALVAHMYRKRLPVALRRSWYRHHGFYKAVGFASIAVAIIFAYGSVGQI